MAKSTNYSPDNTKMILARVDKSNQRFPLEFIDGKHTMDDDQLTISSDLIAGEYYLFVEIDVPKESLQTSYILNLYAKDEILIEQSSYSGFLEKALSSCAM